MKKSLRNRYLIIGILVIVLGAFVVADLFAGTRHSQSGILVDVGGYTMTLQEAMSNNYLDADATSPTSDGTTSVSAGHSPDEIWVSIDGTENTLEYFIENEINLCGSTTTSSYSGTINPGHYANEIDIGGKTLQDAIDEGDFCHTYSWQTGGWSSCSVSCGGGTQTRSVWCQRSDGQTVSDSFCSGTKPATSQICNTQQCYCLVWQQVSYSECNFGGCTDVCGSCNCGCCAGYCLPGLVGQSCTEEGRCCGFAVVQDSFPIKCVSVPC